MAPINLIVYYLSDASGSTNLGSYSYTYDNLGRIRSEQHSSVNSSSNFKYYTYDQYGQLVREDNQN